PDRSRRRSGGRDGPLHGHRAPPDPRPLTTAPGRAARGASDWDVSAPGSSGSARLATRPRSPARGANRNGAAASDASDPISSDDPHVPLARGASGLAERPRRAGLAEEEPEEDQDPPGNSDRGAGAGLASEHLHGDRCAGRLVAVDAAPPCRVAGGVRVLLLERLVAAPGPARPAVADGDQGDAGPPQDEVDDPHQPAPASRRARTASPTTAAFAWPRVAFITWPTKNPRTGFPAR